MSDTPQVDALDFGDQSRFPGPGYGDLWELARNLERENAALREALERFAKEWRFLIDIGQLADHGELAQAEAALAGNPCNKSYSESRASTAADPGGAAVNAPCAGLPVAEAAGPAKTVDAGEVTVTCNEAGECVAVTRTKDEGRILSVIWERKAETPDSGSGWRPIESATEHEDVLIAQVPSPMVLEAYRIEDEWYFPDDDQSLIVQPTHWMPLPAAPGKPKARCGMCGTKMENPICGANDCPQRLTGKSPPERLHGSVPPSREDYALHSELNKTYPFGEAMKAHFVTFLSPGTFMSEETTKPIDGGYTRPVCKPPHDSGSGWISVKDRLPECLPELAGNSRVVVVCDRDVQTLATWYGKMSVWNLHEPIEGMVPTHWLPLPATPEGYERLHGSVPPSREDYALHSELNKTYPFGEAMKAHFVTFLSPGTFMSEETTKPIDSWDVDAAAKMARTIKERYGATPYGFQFTTRERGEKDLDSKETKRSGVYWLGGKVETLAEVEARNDPSEQILRSNMRCNGMGPHRGER